MIVFSLRVRRSRVCAAAPHRLRILPVVALLLALSVLASAASVRGTVTDASGAKVTGATVALLQNGSVVASAVSAADGSYQILTGITGRFYIVVSAKSFRQLETPGFYAGRLDSVERNMVLEPEWVRQSIVVTATGTPTPQPQTSAATTVIGPTDIELHSTLASDLRLMPGTSVQQIGERGAQTSLFIRGGASDDNAVLIDGIKATDLGGRFDFGNLPTTAMQSAEVYRGPNSGLYGADAESGVLNLTTPRGTTSFPSFFLRGDGGNFQTHHEQFTLAGARSKLDYLGAYDWFQTANSLPHDAFHIGSAAANLGWQPIASTQFRGAAHYNVASTGVPNAWDFYRVADNATQKDQDLYVSASVDNQTTASFHNLVRYGAARKREQYALWQPSGQFVANYDGFGDNAYLGNPVTIKGANGSSASGRAVLDFDEQYPFTQRFVSDRDQLVYQGDYTFTPHLQALIGFQFEDERGSESIPSFFINEATERTNYDYRASVHGDFHSRFFYTLGGSLEHYSLFGVATTPRAGFTLYALRPRSGIFSGTRILFNYGDAVREPALTDQFGSLYQFFTANGLQAAAQQLHVTPLAAPTARTYEGGFEQTFLSEHILLRASYFHNQFGRQLEYVDKFLLPNLLFNLTPSQQQQLGDTLASYPNAFSFAVNTQAFRAQGIEATLEGGIGRSLFLRGGYTWLDAVVQRSFDSDNEALTGGYAPTYNGIPIGAVSPLVGARPFRRPPHTGFATATWSTGRIAAIANAAFASRSDDSTYLDFADATGGNSLLLPNRNLDYGYAKMDLGGSWDFLPWLGVYGIAENLASNQHIASIGYVSLPLSFRAGMRFQWGKGSGR
ncbi:TonB-dependent receptor [Acidobacteria bacterium AB60]|nr:TonB-dependent receptor [Acidobacteria bacterium AB60]